MFITTLLLWILYSISEAYEDSQYTVILDHQPTVYPRILHGFMTVWLWCSLQSSPALDVIYFGLVLATTFWFVFELAGNLFKGHYFYFIGTTARSDRWFKRYELPMFFLRFWLMGLAYGLYFHNELNIY